jgi:SHS2 domain-containing protein
METKRIVGFKEIDHTADSALQIFGQTTEQLLLNAAHGMNSLMIADLDRHSPQIEKLIEIEAQDTESLLVEWLAELAFWAETELLVFEHFNFLMVSPFQLQALVIGSKAKTIAKHIKAVTYHNLKIEKSEKGLQATVVFDV